MMMMPRRERATGRGPARQHAPGRGPERAGRSGTRSGCVRGVSVNGPGGELARE
jgi:hypothetical protein